METKHIPTPSNTCLATVLPPGDRRGHLCGKKAWALGNHWGKKVPLCRTHHPEEIERRRIARGPTEYEQEMARIKDRNEKLERLHNLEARYAKLVGAAQNIVIRVSFGLALGERLDIAPLRQALADLE